MYKCIFLRLYKKNWLMSILQPFIEKKLEKFKFLQSKVRSISSNGSNFLFQTVECTSMELQPRPLSWLRPWQSMARRQSSGMWKSCTFIQRGQGLTISQNMKVYYGDKHFKWSVLIKKKNIERRFINRLTYEDWLMLYPHLLWIFHELKYKILITVLNSDPPPKKNSSY